MFVLAASWPSLKSLILNAGGKWKERARDPNVVAKDLLTKMISLLIGTLVFSVELR